MIPVKVRDIVYARAYFACERCGADDEPMSVHHRRPRAMGGSRRPDTDLPSNLLLVCGDGVRGCHGWIESHRADAYARGLLCRQHEDPAVVPVVLHVGRVLLSDTYTATEVPRYDRA